MYVNSVSSNVQCMLTVLVLIACSVYVNSVSSNVQCMFTVLVLMFSVC